jgi:hypothetical protein
MAGTGPTQMPETMRIHPDPVSSLNGPDAQVSGGGESHGDGVPTEATAVEDEPRPWRDGVALSYRHKSILTVPVDIQTRRLSRWRPRSVGDCGRASQDDE